LVFEVIAGWFAIMGVLYIRYYNKEEFKEIKVLFLFIITVFPAFILSIVLTVGVFYLIGIPNAFIFPVS